MAKRFTPFDARWNSASNDTLSVNIGPSMAVWDQIIKKRQKRQKIDKMAVAPERRHGSSSDHLHSILRQKLGDRFWGTPPPRERRPRATDRGLGGDFPDPTFDAEHESDRAFYLRCRVQALQTILEIWSVWRHTCHVAKISKCQRPSKRPKNRQFYF